MGFHVRARVGEGFGVKGPEWNIRVMLKYIVQSIEGNGCKIEVRGSPLVPERTLRDLLINSSLKLAPNIELKLDRTGYKSGRVKLYIDKPREYEIYPING